MIVRKAFLAVIGIAAGIASIPRGAVAAPWDPMPRPGVNQPQWLAKHDALVTRARAGNVRALFLGDSITEYWETRGKPVWESEFVPLGAADFGIAGDRTQYVLWRMQNGELEGLHPDAVVLLIGTNNLAADTPPEIVRGISVILAELQRRLPNAKVLLLGLLPRGKTPDDPLRLRAAEVNSMLPPLADGVRVRYLDLSDAFLESDGRIDPAMMPDYLHPSLAGYTRIAARLRAPLAELLPG